MSEVPRDEQRTDANAGGNRTDGQTDEGAPPPVMAGTCNWTLFRSLPNFDIRNGDPADVTSVLIRATIPTSYHWVPIEDLDPVDATKAVDMYIRSHLAHLAAHPTTDLNDAQVRKAAIAMGTIRAISTSFYRLSTNDFIPGEVAEPYLRAVKSRTGELSYQVRGNPTEAVRAHLTANLELTPAEVATVCQLIKCAAGVIPMQGYSLIMTNHHYLSTGDSQARKVYAVAEKAYWKSADTGNWFTDDAEKVRDIVWHKAAHPVAISVKETTAKDPQIAAKLVSAGAGACASRLPAKETELRAANSYITLFATVSPMFKMFGGDIKMDVFTNVVNAVTAMPKEGMGNLPRDAIPDAYRSLIRDRQSGLNVIGTMVRQNADSAALCYGFYLALTESSTTLGGGSAAGQDTLKSSFSLTKLKNQSHASFVAGTEIFKDYQAVRNKLRSDGVFAAPNFEIS